MAVSTGINLPGGQQLALVPTLGVTGDRDSLGQHRFVLVFFPPSELARDDPLHVRRLDAVFVLQEAPDPDQRTHGVTGRRDRLPPQVLGLFDSSVGANIDALVPEGPEWEDGDQGVVAEVVVGIGQHVGVQTDLLNLHF